MKVKTETKLSLGQLVFVVWFSVLPLIYIRGWQFGYELPKVMWLLIGGSGLFFISGLESGKWEWRRVRWMVWWLLSLIVASYLGAVADKAMWGGVVRWQGVLFYTSLVLVAISVSRWKGNELREWIGNSWLVIAGMSVFSGVVDQFNYLKGLPVANYAGRMVSSFGEPNYWADYLLVGGVYFLWGKKKFTGVDWLALVVVILGLGLSRSKLAMCVFLFLVVMRLVERWGGRVKKWLVLGMTLLSVELIYLSGGLDERVIFWKRALELIKARWWLGYGLESIGAMFGGFSTNGMNGLWVDRSHNLALDMFLYGGVISGLLWIVVNGILIKRLWKEKREVGVTLLVWDVLSMIHVVGTVGFVWWAVLAGEGLLGKKGEMRKLPWWIWGLVGGYVGVVARVVISSFKVWMN